MLRSPEECPSLRCTAYQSLCYHPPRPRGRQSETRPLHPTSTNGRGERERTVIVKRESGLVVFKEESSTHGMAVRDLLKASYAGLTRNQARGDKSFNLCSSENEDSAVQYYINIINKSFFLKNKYLFFYLSDLVHVHSPRSRPAEVH